MDFSSIWDAITRNLATVSFISLGGVLSGGIKWVHRRFNKKHRFTILRDEAGDLLRAFSFYQQSRGLEQRPDQRAFYPVETLDTLVEMLISLQDSLSPLNVYLFSEDEMTTHWLLAIDKPLKDGSSFRPLGDERLREAALAVQSVSRLMRAGDYRKAKREFPPTYDGARLRLSTKIKSNRHQATKDHIEAQGIKDKRPVDARPYTETQSGPKPCSPNSRRARKPQTPSSSADNEDRIRGSASIGSSSAPGPAYPRSPEDGSRLT